jgi:hypothetical protein
MPTVSEKLRVLVEWAPLITLASEITAASTPLERALRISAALRWAARKTGTEADDDLVDLCEAVLRTKEGEALFDYLVKLTQTMAAMEMPE